MAKHSSELSHTKTKKQQKLNWKGNQTRNKAIGKSSDGNLSA